MAYEPKTWSCGETITADELNRMERGIADADKGYECTESRQTLTEESVTTQQGQGAPYASCDMSYSQFIDADEIWVTFNGTIYKCEKITFSGNPNVFYGGFSENGPDFSEYPFFIASFNDGHGNTFSTATAGTYSIKIEAIGNSVETTPCFEAAVKSIVGGGDNPLGDLQILRLDHSSNNSGTYSPTDIDWSKPIIAYEYSDYGDGGSYQTICLGEIIKQQGYEGDPDFYSGKRVSFTSYDNLLTFVDYTFGLDGTYTVSYKTYNLTSLPTI